MHAHAGSGSSVLKCPDQPLRDAVAVITGASSGIGAALAQGLGDSGARLALVARRPDALDAVAAGIGSASPEVRTYPCDLSVGSDTELLAAAVQSDFGGADVLIHCAGVYSHGELATTTESEFERQYQVNLLAPHSLTRLLAQSLKDRRGQVVFINSSVARHAGAGRSQYAATKSGLKAIADSFREELNPDGVRVLSVFLGRVATPMQQAIVEDRGDHYNPEDLLQPSDVAASVAFCLALPCTAEVTELDIRPMRKT